MRQSPNSIAAERATSKIKLAPLPFAVAITNRDDTRPYDRRCSLATMTGPLLMPDGGAAKVAVFRRMLMDLTQGTQA